MGQTNPKFTIKQENAAVFLLLKLLYSYPTSIINPPAKKLRKVSYWGRRNNFSKWRLQRSYKSITHNNEPKNVLPVRTAKLKALSQSLCWCSMGSKIRCSI